MGHISEGTRNAEITRGDYSTAFGVTDSYGTEWVLNSIEFGGELVGELESRYPDMGAWVYAQSLAARTIVLTCTLTSLSHALRDDARDLLRFLLSPSDLATLIFTEGDREYLIDVRRSGPLTEVVKNALTRIYVITLIAPDPRLYSSTLNTIDFSYSAPGGGLTFPVTFPATFPENPSTAVGRCSLGGTLSTPWTATLTGAAGYPGIQWYGTPYFVRVNTTTSVGDVVTFDAYTKTATVNGVPTSCTITSRWWELPPREDIELTLLDDYLGVGLTGSLEYREAYDR